MANASSGHINQCILLRSLHMVKPHLSQGSKADLKKCSCYYYFIEIHILVCGNFLITSCPSLRFWKIQVRPRSIADSSYVCAAHGTGRKIIGKPESRITCHRRDRIVIYGTSAESIDAAGCFRWLLLASAGACAKLCSLALCFRLTPSCGTATKVP